MEDFTHIDIIALICFLTVWITYTWLADKSSLSQRGISEYVAYSRLKWMREMHKRELRMIDTSIIAGLQQGTAFFASSCIFAIGGSFALLGSTDQVLEVVNTLPVDVQTNRGLFEIKILGLVGIYAYAFFKFGWAYRLFNYCSILIGSVPMPPKEGETQSKEDAEEAEYIVNQAGELSVSSGRHFNSGLRAIFLSIAFLSWFVGAIPFIAGSVIIFLVLMRRHFFSNAREILRPINHPSHKEDGKKKKKKKKNRSM